MNDTVNAPSSDEKTMAALAHAGGVLFGFIPALVIWLIKKDQSAYVADQAKEALNFQITMLIAMIVSALLMIVLIGMLLMPIVGIANLVLCIIAAIKASSGEDYRYPFALRLIK